MGEMYSLEKRSAARSVCVRPAETRSCRSLSPSREPRGTAEVVCLEVCEALTAGSLADRGAMCNPPKGTGGAQTRMAPGDWGEFPLRGDTSRGHLTHLRDRPRVIPLAESASAEAV